MVSANAQGEGEDARGGVLSLNYKAAILMGRGEFVQAASAMKLAIGRFGERFASVGNDEHAPDNPQHHQDQEGPREAEARTEGARSCFPLENSTYALKIKALPLHFLRLEAFRENFDYDGKPSCPRSPLLQVEGIYDRAFVVFPSTPAASTTSTPLTETNNWDFIEDEIFLSPECRHHRNWNERQQQLLLCILLFNMALACQAHALSSTKARGNGDTCEKDPEVYSQRALTFYGVASRTVSALDIAGEDDWSSHAVSSAECTEDMSILLLLQLAIANNQGLIHAHHLRLCECQLYGSILSTMVHDVLVSSWPSFDEDENDIINEVFLYESNTSTLIADLPHFDKASTMLLQERNVVAPAA